MHCVLNYATLTPPLPVRALAVFTTSAARPVNPRPQVLAGQMGVALHHPERRPPAKFLEDVQRSTALHMPACPSVTQIVPAEILNARLRYCFAMRGCSFGGPVFPHRRKPTWMLPAQPSSTATALSDQRYRQRFAVLGISPGTQAVFLAKSTWDHSKCVTFARRRPVSRLNSAIAARCSGNAAISASASSGLSSARDSLHPFSALIFGTRSTHSHSARPPCSVLHEVCEEAIHRVHAGLALALWPLDRLGCRAWPSAMMLLTIALSISSRCLSPRYGSSQRRARRSPSSEDFLSASASRTNRITASRHVYRGLMPSRT